MMSPMGERATALRDYYNVKHTDGIFGRGWYWWATEYSEEGSNMAMSQGKAWSACVDDLIRGLEPGDDISDWDLCVCDPDSNTGGVHDSYCPEFEVECTCYEMLGGHMPGCPRRPR